MTRSPLAYPLNRGVDGDAGGAADLQTDIMRFMAILALCLVAIFALVQSIPLVPEPAKPEPVATPLPQPVIVEPPADEPLVEQPLTRPVVAAPEPKPAQTVVLTRPRWQPKPRPEPTLPVTPSPPAVEAPPVSTPAPSPVEPAEQGFTLRFESDLALTRLVASHQVGFFALTPNRSQRMTVSDSRISFWDASTPNAFHEMEAATVPGPVVDALARTGISTNTVKWGVTLPGKLSRQLDSVMREHSGGSLVIGLDGQLRLETGQ